MYKEASPSPRTTRSAHRTRLACLRKALCLLVATILCVSLGLPSFAVDRTGGFSATLINQEAFAAETDGTSADSGSDGSGGSGELANPDDLPDSGGAAEVKIDVPWVIGSSLADAKAALSANGWNNIAVSGSESSQAVVTSQSHYGPTAQGTVITLTTELKTPKVTEVTVGYVDPDTDAKVPFPNAERGEEARIKARGGTIELLSTVTWDTGSQGYASDEGVAISWSSDTPDIATVDQRGVVTPKADGTATIRCTADASGVSGTIKVRIVGQDEAYVTSVAVVREDGSAYKDERIYFDAFDGATDVQLYVMVVYSDGQMKCTAPGSEHYVSKIEGLTWSVNDTLAGYINEDTGRFKPQRDGQLQAIATVQGGEDGPLYGYVNIVIDTDRQNNTSMPADSLHVTVEYEGMPGTVVKEKTYSVSEFLSLGTADQKYTQVRRDGAFQSLAARGVFLTTFMDDLGLDPSAVQSFSLTTTDMPYNPAQLTGEYLFNHANYYYPNFATEGGSLDHAIPALPMIAVYTSTRDNDVFPDNYAWDDLSDEWRFRICFGSNNKSDYAAYTSRYNVSDIKITMKGNPPLDENPNGNGSGGTDSEGDGPGGTDPEGGGGEGSGDDGSGGSDTEGSGTENPTDSDAGQNGDSAEGTQEQVRQGLSNEPEVQAAAPDAAESNDASQQADSAKPESMPDEGPSGEEGSHWEVWEMLSNDESELDFNRDNPLAPYVVPTALGIAAAGGLASRMRFRREMAV